MLYNANSKNGVVGSYDVKYTWDDSIAENSAETFNMYLQSQALGIVAKKEMRSWLMNEPEDVAEKRIAEIEAESEPIEDVAI